MYISLSLRILDRNLPQAKRILAGLGLTDLKFASKFGDDWKVVFSYSGDPALLQKLGRNKLLQKTDKSNVFELKKADKIKVAYQLGKINYVWVQFDSKVGVGSGPKTQVAKPKVQAESLIPFLLAIGLTQEFAESLGKQGIRYSKGGYNLVLESRKQAKDTEAMLTAKLGKPDDEDEIGDDNKPTGNRSLVWSIKGKGLISLDYNKDKTHKLIIVPY